MSEEWRCVPHTEGRYQVSSLGRVRSRTRILKTNTTRGQAVVSIIRSGKTQVHEVRHLIAYAFLGCDILSSTKPVLIHKDGNVHNIQLDNLAVADISDKCNEHWKPVVGFEGVYVVSNLGRVKRLAHADKYVRSDTGVICNRQHPDKILKPTLSSDGYEQINLRCGDRNKYATVHRLVAEAFIDNPRNVTQVNHKDGDRRNNCVTNLEWCTPKENVQDQIARSGRDTTVQAIQRSQGRAVKCIDTQQVFPSIGCVARELSCDSAAITYAIDNATCCYGWTFIYVDMLDSLNMSESSYLQNAQARYFSWPRARVREVKGWKNTYSVEA